MVQRLIRCGSSSVKRYIVNRRHESWYLPSLCSLSILFSGFLAQPLFLNPPSLPSQSTARPTTGAATTKILRRCGCQAPVPDTRAIPQVIYDLRSHSVLYPHLKSETSQWRQWFQGRVLAFLPPPSPPLSCETESCVGPPDIHKCTFSLRLCRPTT